MAVTTKIEWCDATWNVIRGCTRVSPGCGGPGPHGGCYAEDMAARFSKEGQWGHGFAEMKNGVPRWTGKVELVEKMLTLPLTWKRPRKIFVNSTSDLFHEKLQDEDIDRVFAVMALCPQHIFQVLTKRPERMRLYLNNPSFGIRIAGELMNAARGSIGPEIFCIDLAHKISVERKPLPNVWLGTSCEDQERADERIPLLLQTPAAVRFISVEPYLARVTLKHDWLGWRCAVGGRVGTQHACGDCDPCLGALGKHFLDQVICGGESGPHARPMNPQWARSLRDQCAEAGVAFFFKQWGEWIPSVSGVAVGPSGIIDANSVKFSDVCADKTTAWMTRVGKKLAGRLLDGRTHDEFPR